MESREGVVCGHHRLSFDDRGLPTESASNGEEEGIVAFVNSNPGYVSELVRDGLGSRAMVEGVLTTFVGKPPIRASPPSIHGQNS